MVFNCVSYSFFGIRYDSHAFFHLAQRPIEHEIFTWSFKMQKFHFFIQKFYGEVLWGSFMILKFYDSNVYVFTTFKTKLPVLNYM